MSMASRAPATSQRLQPSTHTAVLATTLAQAKPGALLRVIAIHGEDALARRLDDLGFWPGAEVTLERLAPLGDPLQCRLHGYRLALRKSEASLITVEAR